MDPSSEPAPWLGHWARPPKSSKADDEGVPDHEIDVGYSRLAYGAVGVDRGTLGGLRGRTGDFRPGAETAPVGGAHGMRRLGSVTPPRSGEDAPGGFAASLGARRSTVAVEIGADRRNAAGGAVFRGATQSPGHGGTPQAKRQASEGAGGSHAWRVPAVTAPSSNFSVFRAVGGLGALLIVWMALYFLMVAMPLGREVVEQNLMRSMARLGGHERVYRTGELAYLENGLGGRIVPTDTGDIVHVSIQGGQMPRWGGMGIGSLSGSAQAQGANTMRPANAMARYVEQLKDEQDPAKKEALKRVKDAQPSVLSGHRISGGDAAVQVTPTEKAPLPEADVLVTADGLRADSPMLSYVQSLIKDRARPPAPPKSEDEMDQGSATQPKAKEARDGTEDQGDPAEAVEKAEANDDAGAIGKYSGPLVLPLYLPRPYTPTRYMYVEAHGGLNSKRYITADAVANARMLNATLVMPQWQTHGFWQSETGFGDLFDVAHFKASFKGEVDIIDLEELPSELRDGIDKAPKLTPSMPGANLRFMNESFLDAVIRPHLDANVPEGGLFRLVPSLGTFESYPAGIHQLQCKANMVGLKFLPYIVDIAKRVRAKLGDDYVAVHIRREKDIVLRSGCFVDEAADRAWLREVWGTRGEEAADEMISKKPDPAIRCPMSTHNATDFLSLVAASPDAPGPMRSDKWPAKFKAYVVGGEPYGGDDTTHMSETFVAGVFRNSDLIPPEEMAVLLEAPDLLAGIDYLVSLDAALFVSAAGNFDTFVWGFRHFFGRPNLNADRHPTSYDTETIVKAQTDKGKYPLGFKPMAKQYTRDAYSNPDLYCTFDDGAGGQVDIRSLVDPDPFSIAS